MKLLSETDQMSEGSDVVARLELMLTNTRGQLALALSVLASLGFEISDFCA